MVNGKYVIRFCVTYEHATEKDIGKRNFYLFHTKFKIITYFTFSVDAWQEIKAFADDILRDAEMEISSLPPTPEKEKIPSEPVITGKPPIKKKLTRTKSLRFSFTRSISREIYDSQSEHLKDGCTPILVVDSNAMLQSFLKATADNNNQNMLKGIADVDTDEASN